MTATVARTFASGIYERRGSVEDYLVIKRIQQGEKALFGQLMEKYYDEVFRYCYYKTGNEHTAYDCTQETFLRLLRFLESYTERRQFKAYLLRIALNVCRDYFRKGSRTPLVYEEEADMQQELPHARESSWETRVEDNIVIQTALASLPEYQQEVIILYFYHNYKLREIAQITGAPLSTIKSRLRQGMEKLRHLFRKEGIYE